MILKNKFFYSILLILILLLMLIDLRYFIETNNYLFICTIAALSCVLVAMLARHPISKPLLKIWFIIFELVPTAIFLIVAFINLFLIEPIFEVDTLLSSFELFVIILTLALVDKAARLKTKRVLASQVKIITIKHETSGIRIRELG